MKHFEIDQIRFQIDWDDSVGECIKYIKQSTSIEKFNKEKYANKKKKTVFYCFPKSYSKLYSGIH